MNKDEERFIKKNVELLKALTDGDPVKIKDVRRVIEESLQRLTTLPPDHVMTRAMIRRSKWLAEDTEYKYICPTCHRGYNNKEDLLSDMEDHVLDFYAGLPTRLSPAHVKKLKEMIPKKYHDRLKYRVDEDAVETDRG